jgi:hypothetical protein
VSLQFDWSRQSVTIRYSRLPHLHESAFCLQWLSFYLLEASLPGSGDRRGRAKVSTGLSALGDVQHGEL